MPLLSAVWRQTRPILSIYWMLVRITVPITIGTELLSRFGVIKAIAPGFAPVMNLVGLPGELGLAWLTAILVGLWGAVPLLFTLVPASALSTADVTVFSALILFAHGLPIEQSIIEKAGPKLLVTTLLRLFGGLLYALILHHLLAATGWLSEPVSPRWIPMAGTPDWPSFFLGLVKTLFWMLVILLALSFGLDLLRLSGLLRRIMAALSPLLRLTGIRGEAEHLTAIGLFLGISYGAGLLIREARSGAIPPRQVFLACAFMGFAHSVIEDSLLVMALGANGWGVIVGRVCFAVVATAALAALLARLSDDTFFTRLFEPLPTPQPEAAVQRAA